MCLVLKFGGLGQTHRPLYLCRMRWLLGLFLGLMVPMFCFGQKQQEAHRLGTQGIALVDAGAFKEGLKLLSKAHHLDPAAFDFPFELGRTHLRTGNAAKAEKYLFPLQYHGSVSPELYLLLAACYDSLNKSRQQEETYRYGIKKFASDGQLYHALASFYVSRDSVAEGLAVCELGLERAPSFADNYFLASRIMQGKGNALWAWWYGEIFLNLSDNPVMKRGLAKQVLQNAANVFSNKWRPGPERLDLAIADVVRLCPMQQTSDIIAAQTAMRSCFAQHHQGNDPYTKFLRELERQGIVQLYVAHLFGEVDKDVLLPWLAQHGPEYERFKQWFFWNALKLETPFTRHTITQ